MSRKTKIRKRIFGVTSLILAVLVAAVPTSSLALTEIVGTNLKSKGENLSTGLNVLLNEDSTEGDDMHVNEPGQSSGTTFRDMTLVTNNAVVDPMTTNPVTEHKVPTDPLNAASLAGDYLARLDYTDSFILQMEYLGNYAWTGSGRQAGALPYLKSNQWSTTKLFFGMTGLKSVLKQPDYWQGDHFSRTYGQQPRGFVYRSTLTDLDAVYTGLSTLFDASSFSWVPIADVADNKPVMDGGFYSTWNKIETNFQNWFFAIVYRTLMDVRDDRDTAQPDYPAGTAELQMASSKNHALNSGLTLVVSDVPKNAVATGMSDLRERIESLKTAAGEDTSFVGYHEFRLDLNDKTTSVSNTGSEITVGISMPLPAGMSYVQDGWEVWVMPKDTTSGIPEKLTSAKYEYVRDVKPGTDAVQFELDFHDGGTTPTYTGYDVAVVKTKDSSTPPATQFSVEAETANATMGELEWSGSTAVADGTGDHMGPLTLDNADTITVTAKPKSTSYAFTNWTVEKGTISNALLTNPTLTLSVAEINDATERQIKLKANFHDPSVSPDPAILTTQSSNAAWGTVSPLVTDEGGHYVGETVTIQATANPGYHLTGWTINHLTGTPTQRPAQNPLVYILDSADETIIANFEEDVTPDYTLTIEDGRNHQYLMPLSYDANGKLITPDVEKKLGDLYSNTIVRVSDTTTGVTAAHITELTQYLYNTLFHIDVNGAIYDNAGNYTISILDLPLPDYMDENKGKISLFWLDPAGGLVPCGLSTSGNGYATFDIDKDGDYAFIYELESSKNQLHKDDRRQPKPAATSLDATPDNLSALSGDRTLEISNSSDDVKNYADTLQTTLESAGTVVYGGHVQYHLSLKKKTARVNASGQPVRDGEGRIVYDEAEVADINSLELKLPVRTGYANSKIEVYRVRDDGSGTVTPEAKLDDVDVSVSSIDAVTQLVTFTAYSPDYNADYVFLFQKEPALQVNETNREDKPAGLESTAKQTSPVLSDDRWLIIETSRGDKITPLIHADQELGRSVNGEYLYKIIPYDIRYVDTAGNNVTDFNTVRVELTIPAAAQGKFNLDLVAVKGDALEKQLVYENPGTSIYTFTTDHFSEIALVYMEEEPPSPVSKFRVTLNEIMPGGSGTVSGTGEYDPNTSATLSATPNAGFTFQKWTDANGNDLSSSNPWTFNVTADRTVNAVFVPAANTFTVNAYADTSADGTVLVVGGATGRVAGESVLITASAGEGKEIESWEDNGQVVEGWAGKRTYTIQNLDSNHMVVVHFKDAATPPVATYAVTTAHTPPEGGTVSGGGTGLPAGSNVTVTATPAEGYQLSAWIDNAVTQNATSTNYPISNLDKDHTVIAVFTKTDNSGGGNSGGGGTSGGGTVTPTSSTSDGGTASASDNGDGTWKLTAVPQPGYKFDHWEGPNGRTSTDNPLTITPSGNENWKAVFTKTDSGTSNTSGGNVTVTQDTQSGTGTGTTTGGGSSGGTGSTTNQGKNANDMPKTGLFDQFGTYKMIAIILLVLFGAIELLGTVNTKKQRVPVQN